MFIYYLKFLLSLLACWKYDPNEHPTIQDVVKSLKTVIFENDTIYPIIHTENKIESLKVMHSHQRPASTTRMHSNDSILLSKYIRDYNLESIE